MHGRFDDVVRPVLDFDVELSRLALFLRPSTANIFRFDFTVTFDSPLIRLLDVLIGNGLVVLWISDMFWIGKSKTTLPLEPLMAAASLMGKLAIPIGMVTVAASVVAG